MTIKEFKMCCILFTKKFEGKKYKAVVDDCYDTDEDCIISFRYIIFGSKHNPNLRGPGDFGYGRNDMLFTFEIAQNEFLIHKKSESTNFNTVKEFLEYFKIPLEDII